MKKHGQSMIEYVLIAVLVILGVSFMGPYVLRSINAHFKLWDDGVQDSFTENITQATTVPDILVNCTCTPTKGNCGSTQVGSLCGATQREYDYDCDPQGCNGAAGNSYCVYDNTCCIIEPHGCGNVPCPASGCPTSSTTPPPATNNCYYGYLFESNICGSDITQYVDVCVYDAQPSGICPLPQCIGSVSQQSSIPCPNSPGTPGSSLTLIDYDLTNGLQEANVNNAFVANCSNPAAPCQYTCGPGTIDINGACVTIQCSGDNLVAGGQIIVSCAAVCGGCNGWPQGFGKWVCCGTTHTLICSPNDISPQNLCKYFGYDEWMVGTSLNTDNSSSSLCDAFFNGDVCTGGDQCHQHVEYYNNPLYCGNCLNHIC